MKPIRLTWTAVGICAVAVVLTIIAPSPAVAQGGVRVGVSTGPDQFIVGGHLDVGPVTSQVSFRPNLEVGVGDGQTTVAFNAEFVYWFNRRRAPWRVYAGGGPALIVYRFNSGRQGDAHSDVQPGINLLVGLAHARGLFTEVKVGLIDSPELKFTLGYSFR